MKELLLCLCLCSCWVLTTGKWVEGNLDTKENWSFLARFCFLSLNGEFEYWIEFDREMGTPNLLLYYDDDSQWPSVYHSDKTCKEREAVLNKAGQNQIIPLSHWYPDTEFSGCVLRNRDHELPATKNKNMSSTTTPKPALNSNATERPETLNSSKKVTEDPTYYHQFLKTSSASPSTDVANVTWYELKTTDGNDTTTEQAEELWENIAPGGNVSESKNDLRDVEFLFTNTDDGKHHKIKRASFEISERMKRRRLSSGGSGASEAPQRARAAGKLVVSCHNMRRFRSARERWWFIAISNCDSPKGLNIQYRFLMTNGAEDDYFHSHFSADEFYVLPVLIAYTLAYLLMLIAVVMCSVELKTRHLLHTTYKLFLLSVAAQHAGVILMSLAYARYAMNGVGNEGAKVLGQFLCGVSEMTFLLVLVLMAKGYTITRARLRVSFTVKLTIFMCSYVVTYVLLFVYQAQSFDPGAVLYLYESPAGYGLVVLRIVAWFMFVYATVFTIKKFPEKSMFYCPFSICGTLWFFAGPLFILTANSYVDKWVRESVVTAVLLFISFAGHVTFLILTLPVFANKNFPYHVRTTQIGIMEVAGGGDSFGRGMYQPRDVTQAQTVIIPLTRRTEELIGSMYSQFIASAPPLSLEDETKLKAPRNVPTNSPRPFLHQDSTDTNNSSDIRPNVDNIGSFPDSLGDLRPMNGVIVNNSGNFRPANGAVVNNSSDLTVNGGIANNANSRPMNGVVPKNSTDKPNNGKLANNSAGVRAKNGFGTAGLKKDSVFSIETQMARIQDEGQDISMQNLHSSLDNSENSMEYSFEKDPKYLRDVSNPILMSANAKARKNLLEPLGPLKDVSPPSWSLAKGPVGQKKVDEKEVKTEKELSPPDPGFSVSVTRKSSRSSLRQPSDISTIHEQYEQITDPAASNTVDIFAVRNNK